jgi:D-alanyl-D-alanine carboxypeptidase
MLAIVAGILVSAFPAFAAPHLVVDMKSGKVLSRQQEFDRWYPASLTKLMTVYTTFHEIAGGKLSLMSPVRISANALSKPPSKMGFKVGTILNIDTAIKILMVKSANDIAEALAESVGGSEANFVAMMNANAARLGMRDTHYVNPHGLHDPDQYTSARDLAVLTMAIRTEFPAYAGYFKIPAVQVAGKVLRNHNPLLTRFDGTTGMKTGFVCSSGLNIVATAKRGGRELIAVVLGGPTGRERNVRAAKLLTEAFARPIPFTAPKLAGMKPNGPVARIPADMRAEVCGKKSKVVTESGEGESGETFAARTSGPTLAEMEEMYLKPKTNSAASISLALGNATGPDPFNLLGDTAVAQTAAPDAAVAQGDESGEEPAAVSAFSEGQAAQTPWPITPGTKGAKVPIPEKRPDN